MDVGKLPNHINTVLYVWLFFFDMYFPYFISHKFGNFVLIPNILNPRPLETWGWS